MAGSLKLAPSIVAADFARLGEQVSEAERCGADRIHIDVMDGHFVPTLSVGPAVVRSIRRVASLPLEVHLQVADPDFFLEQFAEGADSFVVHAEENSRLRRTIQRIRSMGKRAGVAVCPATSADVLAKILPELDQVLVMTINPGDGRRRFIEAILPKIWLVRQMIEDRRPACELAVEGGIDRDNAFLAADAGAWRPGCRSLGFRLSGGNRSRLARASRRGTRGEPRQPVRPPVYYVNRANPGRKTASGFAPRPSLSTKPTVLRSQRKERFHMMSLRMILPLSLFAICGFAQDVRYNFAAGEDFAKFKTYKWVKITGAQEVNQLAEQQLKAVVDAELAAKGLQKTEADTADLLIGYQAAIGQEKQYTSFNSDWGYGAGWGRGWYGGGMGSSMTTGETSTITSARSALICTPRKRRSWFGVAPFPRHSTRKPNRRSSRRTSRRQWPSC